MPKYHEATLLKPTDCDQNTYKKKKAGPGISLILCNQNGELKAQSYRFDPTKYTIDEVKAWLRKAEITYKEIKQAEEDTLKAKLTIKANQPGTDGLIWNSGTHHVFVNNKPARIHVPTSTIMETFNQTKALLRDSQRLPLGIDHLKPDTLNENEILAKMNLLDVGEITRIGTDGEGIFILESSLNNPIIQDLHRNGELPAYSIVGEMTAKECPTGQVDYILDHVSIDRVDFVEEGGCQVCRVGEQPDNLILTSKKALLEDDNMKINANEAVPVEEETPVVEESEPVLVEENDKEPEIKEDEQPEALVNEAPVAEQEPEPEEEPEEVSDDDNNRIVELEQKIEELQKLVDGKKPNPTEESDFNPLREIDALISEGKAIPRMKDSLLQTALSDPEAFKSLAASLPVIVNMTMTSKLSKPKEEKKKPKTWDEEFGELAKHFRI